MVFALLSTFTFSQSDPRIAKTKTPLSDIPQVTMPLQDNEALLAAEIARREPGVAPRFAVNLTTDICPRTHGQWEMLRNGQALWRLRLFSQNAKSLNLGFTKYHMPRGGSLILYSPDHKQVMGPFTPADNEEHEQLWTPVLDGEEMVVEVQVPAPQQHLLKLELKYVNHDFVGFSEMASGSCNLDVICGSANGWAIVDAYRDIIQSVAAISTGGSLFCTGFLVNNTRQDCTPFFMTANHCGVNSSSAPSLVTYWNFNNPTCRQPNSPASGANGNGSLSTFNTGSVWRAGYAPSDFTLVELDDPVVSAANAFYAGWNAEDLAPKDTVITIHHPNGEEKRISFEFDDTYIGNFTGGNTPPPNPNGTHIIIPDWDIGTTEGGSSGGPIFNNQKQVVGQLHGGAASCSNNAYDAYGRFARSWLGGGTPSTGLKNWLDPNNTGVTALNGRSTAQCNLFVDASPASISLCTPAEAQYTVAVSSNFQSPVTLSTTNLPAGLMASFATNPIAPGASTTLTISNTNALPSGNYSFMVNGTDGSDTNFSTLFLTVSNGLPAVPALSVPVDGAVGVDLLPIMSWSAEDNTIFSLEIATDAGFNNLVVSANDISGNTYQVVSALEPVQEFFWRVKGMNLCGESDWSSVRTFTTEVVACTPGIATDVPVIISSSGTPVVTSTIEILASGTIDDVNVNNIFIDHTWVSDLRMELTSPAGTTIELMNNVFAGDCDEDDLALSFDDQSPNTYAMLDGMCNPTPPALSGVFQPSELLSAFIGEESMGTWTLTVYDEANQDGGLLINWELEICNVIPNDLSITPGNSDITNCLGEPVNFDINLGAGFDGPVMLTANGLPNGATATFSPNPAPPGAQVTVTFSDGTAGSYDIDIIGTASGEMGSTQVIWTVESAPDTPAGLSPPANADDVSVNIIFSWSDVGAAEYLLQFSTDSTFASNLSEGRVSVTTFDATGLLPCTTYYWRVSANGSCGDSGFMATQSFTTEDDLSFTTNQPIVNICNFGTTSVPIAVGPCFADSGLALTVAGLPANANATFSSNPAFSNETVDLEIMLSNVTAGNYPFTVNGTDGTNSVMLNLTLQVQAAAATPVLSQPANQAINIGLEPTLSWGAATGANNYQLQLATDIDFSNIIFQTSQPQTSLTLPLVLDHLTTYYWRVTSSNNCGQSTSAPFSFTTEAPNAVVELKGQLLEIFPNPTSGLLFVKSSAPLNEPVDLQVWSITGKILLKDTMRQGSDGTSLQLAGFPSGVYLIRMTSGQALQTVRIIVE